MGFLDNQAVSSVRRIQPSILARMSNVERDQIELDDAADSLVEGDAVRVRDAARTLRDVVALLRQVENTLSEVTETMRLRDEQSRSIRGFTFRTGAVREASSS
jgi:hypothetical protein